MTADPQTTAPGDAVSPLSRLSRRRPLALGLSLALAGLALPTGPAAATPSATPDQPEPGTGGSTQQPVVVVMDYSSSMLEADADASGTTRIDAAKDATKQLISDTPDDARLGLVVYGNNTPQDCRDISTLHEVGPVDAEALNSQIDALEAVGETPIGASLLHAAEDLKDEEGEKSIILVSDGEPNCNEPPACEAAQDLAGQGIDLTVHTIGFRISGNSAAQETLRCIAEATGGTFTEADDAGSLTEQLRIQTTRAFQGYEAEGDEVTGGTNVAGAVELLPGQYVTELTSGERPIGLSSRTWPEGSVQFFSAPHQQGYFTNVSATLVLPRAEQKFEDGALIAVQPVGTCETGRGYEMSYPGSEDAHPVGTWRSAEATLDERDQERCLTPEGQQVFAVYREGDFQPDTALPVEITVAYEKQEDGLPESADHTAAERTPGTPSDESPTAAQGGPSFNAATELESGQGITDTLVPGETKYYSIPAGYGQAVDLTGHFPQGPDHARSVMVNLYNPLRERQSVITSTGATGFHGATSLGALNIQDGETFHGGLQHTLLPENRAGNGSARRIAAAGVPGPQHISVTRQYEAEAGDTELAFELTAEVTGQAQDGGIEFITTAEQYRQAFGEDDPAQQEETDPAGESEPSSEDTAEPAPQDEADPAAAADASESGTDPLPWILGGLAGLLVLGGIAMLLVRNSRRQDGSAGTASRTVPRIRSGSGAPEVQRSTSRTAIPSPTRPSPIITQGRHLSVLSVLSVPSPGRSAVHAPEAAAPGHPAGGPARRTR